MKETKVGKYLIVGPSDMKWGVVVTSVGNQTISPGEDYPPRNHPSRYLFSSTSGRILNEFQLVYIVHGRGFFTSETTGKIVKINAGDVMLLFPGEWHNYYPDKETGWVDMWIGFKGAIPESWVAAGIISKESPVLHPGIHNRLEQMFMQGIEYANSGAMDYQKVLGGTAINIVGTALYFDRNNILKGNEISKLMEDAREIIISSVDSIKSEEVAQSLGISYSKFRKTFKNYYGMSPCHYILQARIAEAKELLTNTDLQIQEIGWKAGFENPDYFSTTFLRISGQTPKEYRNLTRSEIKK